jgi:hypothetical protein
MLISYHHFCVQIYPTGRRSLAEFARNEPLFVNIGVLWEGCDEGRGADRKARPFEQRPVS